MTDFFPRTSIAWRLEQPHLIRRMTLSLPWMALLTGVVMRLWRSFALTFGSPESWAWVGGTFLAGAAFLFLMCAVHLANFTLRNWTWRAPLFAVLEAGTEIGMSLVLTAASLEPLGADKAELSDWLPTGLRILFWRLLGVVIFTVVLAAVVSVLRRIILAADHRGSTVAAVHRGGGDSQEPDSGAHT